MHRLSEEDLKVKRVISHLDKRCPVCPYTSYNREYDTNRSIDEYYYLPFCNKCLLQCYKNGPTGKYLSLIKKELRSRGLL